MVTVKKPQCVVVVTVAAVIVVETVAVNDDWERPVICGLAQTA